MAAYPGSSKHAGRVPDKIAGQLREKILSGKLRPGERLSENRISVELKVGQPTVREALFGLEREGLVERVPNLGTFVRELGLREASDLYQVRAELEGLAARLAAQRAQPQEIEELLSLAVGMKSAAKDHGKEGFLTADLAFHRYLWQLSGNAQLAAFLEPVVVPLLAFGYREVDRSYAEFAESADLHISIAESLTLGPDAAAAAMQANIRRFLERYFAHVLKNVLPIR